MFGSLFFRLLSAVAPSVAQLLVSTPAAPPDLQDVLDVRALPPVEVASGPLNSGSQVVVPLTIEVDKDGQRQQDTVNLPLDGQLVDLMKQGLGSQATRALRGLEDALLEGLQQPNEQVKLAAAEVLPLVQQAVPYRVNQDVLLPVKIEEKVQKIASKVYDRTGARVVVTSAARTPERQADAMRIKMDMGESPLRLYANKKAAGEVANAYSWAKKVGLDTDQVTDTMAIVIQRQIDRGVYISRHLRQGAIDFRSRDLSPEAKVAVREAAKEEGAKVMLESTPPHFHIEVM